MSRKTEALRVEDEFGNTIEGYTSSVPLCHQNLVVVKSGREGIDILLRCKYSLGAGQAVY